MSSSSVQVTRPPSSAGTGKDVANTSAPGTMSFDYLDLGTDIVGLAGWVIQQMDDIRPGLPGHLDTSDMFRNVFTVLAQNGLVEAK
ncbi:uncharacterized protein BDW70DRAFT_162212 [Aspergillus foveolatus]|uniref:uncharacterized protein n=1 Tax=Aspergillus foveolatus TaxID=210207 RepID=UPI003CCDC1AA